MLIKIGILLIIWLSIGLVSGFKLIYLDKVTKEMVDAVENDREHIRHMDDSQKELVYFLNNNKMSCLSIFILLGGLTFYIDTVRTFRIK